MLGAKIRTIAGSSLILLLALSVISCKSPTSPKDGEADIIVLNEYGQSLDIYQNGSFIFSLMNKEYVEIDNVALGAHFLEAKLMGTDETIDTEQIEVLEKKDYGWEIDDPADIVVTNESGIKLDIYLDHVFQFTLDDEEYRWILDVPHGTHFLKAFRTEDQSPVASLTVKIDENKDYSWTISW
jgi:hypothetical protein